MGGGRVMATAAKVAGIGVAKGGFRGGFGVPAAANDQFIVRNTSASKPVSASISSAVHPSVEEDAVVMRKPVWEDEWEFAEVETKTIPRVVFDKPPSLQEAKEATDDLKDALNMACMEGSNEVGSVSRMFSSFQPSENRAVESAVPQVALKAFAFLSENTAAQSVVTSIASDPKVWDAVMENKDLMKFLETNKSEKGEDGQVPLEKIMDCVKSCIQVATVDDIISRKADLIHVLLISLSPGFLWNVKMSGISCLGKLCSRFQSLWNDSMDGLVPSDATKFAHELFHSLVPKLLECINTVKIAQVHVATSQCMLELIEVYSKVSTLHPVEVDFKGEINSLIELEKSEEAKSLLRKSRDALAILS